MQCRYCGTWNELDEPRCVRCGRRLALASARSAVDAYPIQTSTAPAFETIQGGAGQREESTTPATDVASRERDSQPSLFRVTLRDGSEDASNVIPIPTLLPPDSEEPRRGSGAHRNAPRPRPPRQPDESQQRLDLQAAATAREHELEPVRDCEACVASPTHRLIAAAVDICIILAGMGVFWVVLLLAGDGIPVSRQTVPVFALVGLALVVFYRALFCLGDADTPGMSMTGLHLVDFDGRRPDRHRRGWRQVASLVSLLSAGLGLVWALVDDENLDWTDHISKTFPTVSE